MARMWKAMIVFGFVAKGSSGEVLVRKHQSSLEAAPDGAAHQTTQQKTVEVDAAGNVVSSDQPADSTRELPLSLIAKSVGVMETSGEVLVRKHQSSLEASTSDTEHHTAQQKSVEVDAAGNVASSDHSVDSARQLSPSLIGKNADVDVMETSEELLVRRHRSSLDAATSGTEHHAPDAANSGIGLSYQLLGSKPKPSPTIAFQWKRGEHMLFDANAKSKMALVDSTNDATDGVLDTYDRLFVLTSNQSVDRCDGWCNGHTSPWQDKCAWSTRACSGCVQCAALPTPPPSPARTCPRYYPICDADLDCTIIGASAPWNDAPTADTPPGTSYNYIKGYNNLGTSCHGDFFQAPTLVPTEPPTRASTTTVTTQAALPRYSGACWNAGSNTSSRDASCEGDLVCARLGYDGRNFGDCQNRHCCSQAICSDDSSRRRESIWPSCAEVLRDEIYGCVIAASSRRRHLGGEAAYTCQVTCGLCTVSCTTTPDCASAGLPSAFVCDSGSCKARPCRADDASRRRSGYSCNGVKSWGWCKHHDGTTCESTCHAETGCLATPSPPTPSPTPATPSPPTPPPPTWCRADGTTCSPDSSCRYCCNDYTYWNGPLQHRCGTEPCWPKGTHCGLATQDTCCNGADCHWYWFGVCKCK